MTSDPSARGRRLGARRRPSFTESLLRQRTLSQYIAVIGLLDGAFYVFQQEQPPCVQVEGRLRDGHHISPMITVQFLQRRARITRLFSLPLGAEQRNSLAGWDQALVAFGSELRSAQAPPCQRGNRGLHERGAEPGKFLAALIHRR